MKLVLVLLLFTAAAFAHHGPKKSLHHENDHRIIVLSKKISDKPSASLLAIRAQVFIELGNTEKAVHDLEHALMLDKNHKAAKSLLEKLK
ncbi:MAG: hypothetical protein NE328_08580 [Lentisphaeraceae bacterium]|nr:hypothetical protein [Lentisphaeraceae bacterium]